MKYCQKDGSRLKCLETRTSGAMTTRRYGCPQCGTRYKTFELLEAPVFEEKVKKCSHAKTCKYRLSLGDRGLCDAVDEKVCEFAGYLSDRYHENYVAKIHHQTIKIEL